MKNISLIGQRANRTPLNYPEYKRLFQKYFNYIQNPEEADFLIFSCLMDMRDNVDEIERIVSLRPDIQLVILSEEPLWDTVYSDNFVVKRMKFSIGERDYPCTFLNHSTTRIFDFEKIPYFLTTCNDYFARYSFLFARNRALQAEEFKAIWAIAPIRVAFYAEYRDEARFDTHFPGQDIQGLSRYRTLVAKEMKGDGVIRVGKGWENGTIRQVLPDWHLDKLAALDRRCFIMSGIENTHQCNYISEKLFDAFAVVAVPLYFGSQTHGVLRSVPADSFINIHDLSVEQAVEKILAFIPDSSFLDQYRATQAMLSDTFSEPRFLAEERIRIVTEIISEFDAI